MDYLTKITNLRKVREEEINKIKEKFHEDPKLFDYFPINEHWKIPVKVTIRKPRDAITDFNDVYQRIGRVDVSIDSTNIPLTLYKLGDDEKYFVCLRDLTSDKTSYPVGRIVPLLKEEENFYVDFNLAFAPFCGHLIELVPCPLIRDSISIPIDAGEKYIPTDSE